MKVLVTGGAGYIGSVLIPELLAKGYEVTCLDGFFFGGNTLKEVESDPRLKIIKDDTRRFDPEILRNVSIVIDLAAIAQPDPTGQLDPKLFHEINYLGSVRVARLSKKYGVEKYIFPSTCGVYGFREGILNEDSPLSPIEAYGKTKAQTEKEVLALSDREFSVTVLRFGTVYGLSPKMRFDLLINGMTLSLFKTGKIGVMKDGTQWRPVLHVRDVVNVYLKFMGAEEGVSGEIFNVGSNDQNFQIYSLAKVLGDSVGIPYEIEWYGEPDTRSYRVDFSKVSKIGFKTEFTPKEGIKEIYDALKAGAIEDTPETYLIEWYKQLQEKGILRPQSENAFHSPRQHP